MDFGNGRQQASRQFWDAINRNKMGNADGMWDAITDVGSARAQALGLAPIRPTAAQEATADAARAKRAKDYWRNPGPNLGPFPAGDQVVQRERIPGGPMVSSRNPGGGGPYTAANPPRMQPGASNFSPGSGDYEALLTRARNGYYLDQAEREALVGKFGSQLASLLDVPAQGAAHRPREFRQRADRLKMMAALGLGNAGAAAGGMAPPVGGVPMGVAPGGVPAGGAPVPQGNAMPSVNPNAVGGVSPMGQGVPGGMGTQSGVSAPTPLPGYQGMQQATPLDTMASGKEYLQGRAQVNRAARDFRRSGFNPQMAALLAREEQYGNRGFRAESELMNRGVTNQANAQAMGYNQGLGDLNVKDRTRQDRVDAAGREAGFRDREYTDRKAMMDRLMGGGASPSGSANPLSGPTSSLMNDEGLRYLAMEMMSPGLGKTMAEADANRRSQPDATSQLQAAAMAASGGDPLKFRQLMQAMNQSGGGAAMPSAATSMVSPSQDESGNPVVNEQYLRGMLDNNPGMTAEQVAQEAAQGGIPQNSLRSFAAGQMPSPLGNAMRRSYLPSLGLSSGPGFGPVVSATIDALRRAPTSSPESRKMKQESDRRYQQLLQKLLGIDEQQPNAVQTWWNSPGRANAVPRYAPEPDFAAPMY